MKTIKVIEADELEEILFEYCDVISDELIGFLSEYEKTLLPTKPKDIEDESDQANAWWSKYSELIDKHENIVKKELLKFLLKEDEK